MYFMERDVYVISWKYLQVILKWNIEYNNIKCHPYYHGSFDANYIFSEMLNFLNKISLEKNLNIQVYIFWNENFKIN
jgi:hypothetical protein